MRTIKVDGKTYQKSVVFGNQAKRIVFENAKKQKNKMQCRNKGNKK